jgi:hypothetical protein
VTVSPAFDNFIAALRADAVFAPVADRVAEAIRAADLEGDGNVHAIEFHRGLEWIISQPRTLREKIDMIDRYVHLEGKVTIFSMKAWTGW